MATKRSKYYPWPLSHDQQHVDMKLCPAVHKINTLVLLDDIPAQLLLCVLSTL